MKILLINPLIDNSKIYGKFAKLGGILPPLGLCYIAAVLEKNGYQPEILDANVLRIINEKIPEIIADKNIELIGITATTLSYYSARSLAKLIKLKFPDLPIVLGGPHVLSMESEVLKEDCFDYAVSGEGEITISELVNALADKNSNDFYHKLKNITGLTYKKNNEIIVNPPRELIADLDTLPFPARHLLPNISWYKPKVIQYKRLPSTHIFTSRGCPYKCVFCRTSFGKEVRFHSPEYVISEIEHLVTNYGIREVIINDDTFTIDVNRVEKICELIIQKKIDITWSCNVRANLVSADLLNKMKNAGCWQVMIGIESGNEEILKNLKKGATVAQGINACKLAYQAGLEIRPTFILGSPGETKESIEQTINLAMSLPVHFPAFMLMTPFPGTELWDNAEKYGVFDKHDFNQLSVSSNASFVPFGLTAEYLKQKQQQAFRRVYFRPQMVWRHLKRLRTKDDFLKLFNAFISMISG